MTTNVYNPANGVFAEISQIIVTNKTASAATFSLWIGATGANAAGTELFNGQSVAPNNQSSWFFQDLKLSNSDFLVGGAGTATALTITILGEEYLVQV
jgi:hypothetical protein